MNTKLLLEIKEKILLMPRNFKMSAFFSTILEYADKELNRIPDNCGTTCCIAGWAISLQTEEKTPLAGKMFKYRTDGLNEDLGAQYLDLTSSQAVRLFSANYWPEYFQDQYDAAETYIERAQIAAKRIDHFIATEGLE